MKSTDCEIADQGVYVHSEPPISDLASQTFNLWDLRSESPILMKGVGAGVGVGMLRGRGVLLNGKIDFQVSCFLVLWFLGFVVTRFLGFLDSKCQSFKDSK